MHMGRQRVSVLVVALLLATCGCSEPHGSRGAGTEGRYGGPLFVPRAEAEHRQAGAAGDVVDCRTWGSGGFNDADVYGEGATADTPQQALQVASGEAGFGGIQKALRVARKEATRVLYVAEVKGEIKQAVIVRNGPATAGAGGAGWYVESWAHCDYAELPRSFTDSLGLQVWQDRAGHAVPTTTLQSFAGPKHCSWESMTFLQLGDSVYVRAPQPELREYFKQSYEEHARLPADAVDTGFERRGDKLWLSADKQRAFIGTVDDVESWPRTVRRLGCA
jgi:hypothetical protein